MEESIPLFWGPGGHAITATLSLNPAFFYKVNKLFVVAVEYNR